ncbi:MAG: hypothetical protein JWP26_2309 [Devosia sp.]|uniref:YcxB family protein n=1 Tax=Devosia sp. TaxID=1871048 RepID=UPI002607B7AF|nr:YcxB family protein [Devosia sp.]MDB5587339.1 hypothetical protein [Devosia sp.]
MQGRSASCALCFGDTHGSSARCPSFAIHYRFSSSDFVALNRALARPWWVQIAVPLTIWVIVVLVVLGQLGLKRGDFSGEVLQFVQFRTDPPWLSWFLGIALLLSLTAPLATLLQARMIYKSNVSAEQDVSGVINGLGVATAIKGLSSTIEWASVRKVIATDTRLFLAISAREALVLPARGFDSADDFVAAIAFARRVAVNAR